MSAVGVVRLLRSSPWTGADEETVNPLAGEAAPAPKPLSALRDDVVRGEADAARSGTSRHALELAAARTLQALARGFLARRTYKKYRHFVAQDLEALRARRLKTSIILMQKITRGFLARCKLAKMEFLDDERRKEESQKKGGKKAPPPKKGTPAAPPPPVDLSTVPLPSREQLEAIHAASRLRNAPLVAAVRLLLDDKLDECAAALDAIVKSSAVALEALCSRLVVVVQKRKASLLGVAASPTQASPTGGKKKK